MNTGVEEGATSQSKRTDLLQSVHANDPAVTTSALPKKKKKLHQDLFVLVPAQTWRSSTMFKAFVYIYAEQFFY